MSRSEKRRRAEAAARVYLEMRGFSIIEQNWRQPRAEIDIIAEKDGVVHLAEVSYVPDNEPAGGLEALTPSKLKQIQHAAEVWVNEAKYRGEYMLSQVEVAGRDYTVMSFTENVF